MGLLVPAVAVNARETVVTGTAGVGYDYSDRTYENENVVTRDVNGNRRQVGIWPKIQVDSQGERDSLLFQYAPVFKYDDVTSESKVDQYLDLSGQRFLTREWSVALSDRFVLSDDSSLSSAAFSSVPPASSREEQAEEPPSALQGQQQQPVDELSNNLGRRRYWTNSLNLDTLYGFARESSFGFGYGYRVLRNESGDSVGYDEYDKHDVYGSLGYRFSSYWRSDMQLRYVRGLYNDNEEDLTRQTVATVEDIIGVDIPAADNADYSQDLNQYYAQLKGSYRKTSVDTVPLIYSFTGTDYDSNLYNDIWAHSVSVGWEHAFSPRTHVMVGGGPSYVNAEGVDGEWDYNLYATFSRDYQHASLVLSLVKQYDTQNFSGSRDSGLRDTYNARADLNYQYSQDLSFNVNGFYRWESILDPKGAYYVAADGPLDPRDEEKVGDVSYDRDTYGAGIGLTYSFLRWYQASVQYSYYKSDGNLDRDTYYDHKVLVKLTGTYDLWRW